jgi:hypothetical protein
MNQSINQLTNQSINEINRLIHEFFNQSLNNLIIDSINEFLYSWMPFLFHHLTATPLPPPHPHPTLALHPASTTKLVLYNKE